MHEPDRPFGRSLLRGLAGQCPNCGRGKLFRKYLKVQETCQACGHDLDQYPADDGPAYFTILLVGHLVVAPLLVLSFIWRASLAVVVPATVLPLAVITLAALPVVKGGVVGALYAFRVTRADQALHTADRAD
ncbi:MAG TPA: DUF983 domain-containing protein [Caulobacteraceae bacterium]|nr:DUF983 domain-containing protein [Caulobacteraceae bacterium]